MKVFTKSLPLVMAAALAACASNKSLPPDSQLPDWVLNPPIQNQFAGASCVNFSGQMDIDQQAATAQSRVKIAQQMQISVDNLVETMQNRTDVNNGIAAGADFSSVSRQLAQQSLKGAILEKTAFGKIDDRQQLCTLVTLNGERSKALFKGIVEKSGANLSAQDEDVQFQKFLAAQARDRLDKAIQTAK